MKRTKIVNLLISFILCFAMLLCGCGNQSEQNSGNQDGDNAVADGTTEIMLWHTWGSKNASFLHQLAQDFNASQDKYTVVLTNQDSSNVIRQKLAMLNKDSYPSIICGQPTATAYYDTVDYIKPLQEFIDGDTEDWTAEIYDSVKNAYCNLDGEMLGSPFGVSCTGYFVNVDAIEKAGYSLEDLTSFEKIVEVAKAVTAKGICDYGLSFYPLGVDLLDILTVQGVDVLDQGNGYDGVPTKSLFMEGDTKKSIEKIGNLVRDLYNSGAGYAYGATTTAETQPSFYNGNLAICMATTSTAGIIADASPEFKYDFIPMTGIDANAAYQGDVLPAGTGLYICDTGNDVEMQGAYEFIKFVTKAENQAYWCSKVGYLPYTEAALTNSTYVTWAEEKFPTLIDLSKQLKDSTSDLRGPYTDAQDTILDACIKFYSNITSDLKGDLDEYIKIAGETIDETVEINAMRK